MDRAARRLGFGLTARTSAAVAAVFVPFVVALVLLSLQYFQRQYEEGIAEQQRLLAGRTAAGLDQRLATMRDMLGQIAAWVEPRYLADPRAGGRFLDERIAMRLVFDEGIWLVDGAGRVVAEHPGDAGRRGADLSADEAWRAVQRSGLPAFSRPYRSLRGTGGVALTIAVPVRAPGGAAIGQLHGAVRLDGPNVAGELGRVVIGHEGFFVVVTRERVRVFHPDEARVLGIAQRGMHPLLDRALDAGFEGVAEGRTPAGRRMLSASAHIPTLDWFLLANLPLDEVRAPFVAARPVYATAVAIGALLLVLAVWGSLRRATRPLVEMTAAVERIAGQPAAGQRIGGAGTGEVGRLAASFDRLLEALDAREEAAREAEERRRALEAELERQHRLDSLGVLAGGIAHDFNNLLTPIVANASVAAQDLPEEHPLRADMQEIVVAARYGAELAQRILAFGRRQVLALRTIELNAELRAMEQTLRRLVGEAVELRVEPAEFPAKVRADPAQLQQVLVVLVTNAREAMPHGGRVTIAVQVPGLDGRTPWMTRDVPGGAYATLSVTDTGVGIDAETLPRIFEPFFTTKGRAHATGLGLAAVHGILRQHGGDVEVVSARGAGTTFRLFLPLEVGAARRDAEEAPAAAASRPMRILLVEDEPAVRALADRLLTRAGHEVRTAGAPSEALALADGAPPDLLVSDVMLPEMDGIELHARLAGRWPGLPVLFMSGYPGGDARLEDAIARGEHFLQKPFGPAELLAKVQEAAAKS